MVIKYYFHIILASKGFITKMNTVVHNTEIHFSFSRAGLMFVVVKDSNPLLQLDPVIAQKNHLRKDKPWGIQNLRLQMAGNLQRSSYEFGTNKKQVVKPLLV